MHYYKIGELQFSWDCQGFELKQDNMMQLFSLDREEIDESKPMIHYHGKQTSLEIYRDEKRLYKDGLLEIYETSNGKLLVYHWATKRFGYGFFASEMEKENDIEIFLHPDLSEEVPLNATRFFSTLGLHSHLLRRHFAVLHASYIEWKGRAILFAAPSQTGKSTQAKLWEAYQGARILNEDRVLIGKHDGVWRAYGYPCSGSSPICVNESYPLRSIVVLKQGAENGIERLSLIENIQKLVAGIEIYRWSAREINLALGMAQELVADVPVIQLTCTPDESAVDTLKNYLEGE